MRRWRCARSLTANFANLYWLLYDLDLSHERCVRLGGELVEDIEKFVVEQLYEVVTSPDQYDEFMRSLEAKLVVLRAMNKRTPSTQVQSHLDRASSLVDVVTPWQLSKDSALHQYLSVPLQPMIAFDSEGSVIDANSAARVLYDLPPKATVDNLPLGSACNTQLRDMVAGTITGRPGRNCPNNVIRLRNIVNKRALLVTLEPYKDAQDDQVFAIVKTGDINWPAHLGPILNDLFGLSRAEIEVLRLLVSGERVEDIATQRNNSVATIRTQLRSAFAKTDTASQMECVRLILGLALMHSTQEGHAVAKRIQASIDTRGYPRDEDRELFSLANGRHIEYSVFGAAKGNPVLFFHDQAFGDTWFREAVEDATRAGLKVIAPLRPGFGRTTLYRGFASDPHEFAPDVLELMDHLDIHQAPVITMRSGLVHALALSAIAPRRINTITAANPILPVRCDADLEGTNGYNRLIPHTRLHFPQALKFLCKAGFAFVTAKGPEAFATSVLRASPRDVEWASRPDILPVLVSGLYVHRKNGYRGNFGDIAYSDDWSKLLSKARCSVRLVIGEHDRNVQWAAAKRWASTHDHIRLHILPNSGYMVLHQQNGQCLKWLKEDIETSARS